MEIKKVKDSITIEQASRLTDIPVVSGYQDCPFCRGSNKLRVQDDYYNCFNPDCDTKGDVYSFLRQTGKVSSFLEAYNMLSIKVGLKDSYHAYVKSVDTIEAAFNIYKKSYNEDAYDFLISRGYKNIDSPFFKRNIGFAPADKALLAESNLDKNELINLGLLYENGAEYYSNRVIIAIRNSKGRVVHMQGRDLDPGSTLRWKSTKNSLNGSIPSITHYLFNESTCLRSDNTKTLLLSEGATDALSLIDMGIECVSTFGINADMTRHLKLFSKYKNLVVLMDGDRYSLNNSNSGLYKSWSQFIKCLVELQIKLPELTIICCPPPSTNKIKDINDWYKEGLTKKALQEYVKKNGVDLHAFINKEFGHRLEYHPYILRATRANPTNRNKRLFKETIDKIGFEPVDYLLHYTGTNFS